MTDLAAVPAHDLQPDYYSDWGDPREFTLGDMGVGECAGEVVSLTEFDLASAEAQIFEAQLRLEEADSTQANQLAYQAMLLAAKGLIKKVHTLWKLYMKVANGFWNMMATIFSWD